MEFSMKDLYQEAPFIVIPNKEHLQPVDIYFYVKILDEESCLVAALAKDATIVDFRDESIVVPSAPFHIGGTYKFGEEISNPFTSFRILLNSNYKSEALPGEGPVF